MLRILEEYLFYRKVYVYIDMWALQSIVFSEQFTLPKPLRECKELQFLIVYFHLVSAHLVSAGIPNSSENIVVL